MKRNHHVPATVEFEGTKWWLAKLQLTPRLTYGGIYRIHGRALIGEKIFGRITPDLIKFANRLGYAWLVPHVPGPPILVRRDLIGLR